MLLISTEHMNELNLLSLRFFRDGHADSQMQHGWEEHTMQPVCPSSFKDCCFPECFNLIAVLKFDRRARRKNHEIDRVYSCTFDGCTKAFGEMSHLNTHRKRKGHGPPLKKAHFHHTIVMKKEGCI